MRKTGKIDYVEFPASDMEVTKAFYTKAFGWRFTDYGAEYAAFSDAGLDGGFFVSTGPIGRASGDVMSGALVVLYSSDLEATKAKVEQAGGTITKPVFSFPGGRRFHFEDPNRNELAVWSDLAP
ncbi:MAG: glyoxalase [unclassified Hahellaceae]|nr:glyoxalase [Hahellaceae bacterium]|tara:strand:- start:121517 stop:121888 length:372 start_codon:yes stop_codon:yes gene_type:complete